MGKPEFPRSASLSPRRSALAIIEGEHAAFDGALAWILGQVRLARAHRIARDPGVFALAERVLEPSDWSGIDAAFRANCAPLFGSGREDLTSIMAKSSRRD